MLILFVVELLTFSTCNLVRVISFCMTNRTDMLVVTSSHVRFAIEDLAIWQCVIKCVVADVESEGEYGGA